jgi:hypothetical protein
MTMDDFYKQLAKTGGNAFPDPATANEGYQPMYDTTGLTKREYFAAQALPGIIQGYAVAYGSPTKAMREICAEAWAFADLMLETGRIKDENMKP